jgi:hypothetical protein
VHEAIRTLKLTGNFKSGYNGLNFWENVLSSMLINRVQPILRSLCRGFDISLFRSKSCMVHNYRSFVTEIPRKSVLRMRKVLHLFLTMKTRRKWVESASDIESGKDSGAELGEQEATSSQCIRRVSSSIWNHLPDKSSLCYINALENLRHARKEGS